MKLNTSQKSSEIYYHEFESYKELKKAAREINPDITKEEIYEKLLEPFRHEKIMQWSDKLCRFVTSYICRYKN